MNSSCCWCRCCFRCGFAAKGKKVVMCQAEINSARRKPWFQASPFARFFLLLWFSHEATWVHLLSHIVQEFTSVQIQYCMEMLLNSCTISQVLGKAHMYGTARSAFDIAHNIWPMAFSIMGTVHWSRRAMLKTVTRETIYTVHNVH